MSDREARALGAGDTITVNGTDYELRPIVARHLCELEREALKYYKRQYLETFSENQDLLGESNGFLQKKMEEVARWDLTNLPQIPAYDVRQGSVGTYQDGEFVPSEKVAEWIKENDWDTPDDELGVRALLVAALDEKTITPEEVKEMTGVRPGQARIRYDSWWVTGSMAGRIAFVFTSVRYQNPKVKREHIASWPYIKLLEASALVQTITSASLGNM